jgi:hypothetical protein
MTRFDARYPLEETARRREAVEAPRHRPPIPIILDIPLNPGIDLPAFTFTEPISTPEFYRELTNYACTQLVVEESFLVSNIRVRDLRNDHWFRYFKPDRVWIDVTTDLSSGGVGLDTVSSLNVLPATKDPDALPGEIALIEQLVAHPDGSLSTKTLRLLKGLGINGTLIENTSEDSILTITATGGGSSDAIINMDSDYPLAGNQFYSAAPTSDPNGVLAIETVPVERRLKAQVLAFKGIGKGYLIQNNLDIVNLPPYDDTNPNNYGDFSNWKEVNAWWLVDFMGGYAYTDSDSTLWGGDAAGTGLQEVFGGYVL